MGLSGRNRDVFDSWGVIMESKWWFATGVRTVLQFDRVVFSSGKGGFRVRGEPSSEGWKPESESKAKLCEQARP